MAPEFQPFAGLAAIEVLIVVVATVVSFVIRGAFGFGSNLPFILVTAKRSWPRTRGTF